MTAKGGTALAVLVYTVLRVALFAVVWAVINFLTPIHGLWAAAAAILISGAISIVVLDRPRNKVGAAAGTFFGRINERIDASARAEDDDEPTSPAPAPAPSRDSENEPQNDSVAEQ